MLKIADYRRHAAECRRLAAKAGLADIREQLLKMAETWDTLAETRERQINKKPHDRSS